MEYDYRNRKRTGKNYYYFTSHDYAISNIRNNRIKLSTFNHVNDIHELISINFTKNDSEALKAIEHYKNEMGFISFSRFWDSPLMWGHYSDNNKGICLGFEINDYVDDTEYATQKMQAFELNDYDPKSNKTSIANIRGVINRKSLDWIYEQESRFFENLQEKDIETGLYFKEFDENFGLKEIIIGPKSQYNPNDILKYLEKIRFKGPVNIFKIKPSKDYYLMEKDDKY